MRVSLRELIAGYRKEENFMNKIFAKLSVAAIVMTSFVFSACASGNRLDKGDDKDRMTDSRDGKTYKTVKIGDQVWMAENLNFKYNKGSAKSFCYKDVWSNCDKYGRLYTWSAAMDSAAVFSRDGVDCGDNGECNTKGNVRGVCPAGWHLPSREEFEKLLMTVGGRQDEQDEEKWISGGNILKARNGNGDDSLGFGALPAGYYQPATQECNLLHWIFGIGVNLCRDRSFGAGGVALFWTSTRTVYSTYDAFDRWYDLRFNKSGVRRKNKLEVSRRTAYGLGIYNQRDGIDFAVGSMEKGYSVRCIKD